MKTATERECPFVVRLVVHSTHHLSNISFIVSAVIIIFQSVPSTRFQTVFLSLPKSVSTGKMFDFFVGIFIDKSTRYYYLLNTSKT